MNLAQSEGLISGYGNGRFGPDDPVTIGQAVTIVLRLMGYGEEDVGPFWPQDYLSKGTDLGLLEGVRTQADAAMTRGEAALLLYAMLQSNCKDGASYVEKLAHTTVSDAVLLQNDDTSPSGEVHTAQVYAGNSGLTWYTQDTALPDTLLNRRGTLLLNESGAVSGFLPDESTVRTLSLAEAKADRLVDESGANYTLSSAVTLVWTTPSPPTARPGMSWTAGRPSPSTTAPPAASIWSPPPRPSGMTGPRSPATTKTSSPMPPTPPRSPCWGRPTRWPRRG